MTILANLQRMKPPYLLVPTCSFKDARGTEDIGLLMNEVRVVCTNLKLR